MPVDYVTTDDAGSPTLDHGFSYVVLHELAHVLDVRSHFLAVGREVVGPADVNPNNLTATWSASSAWRAAVAGSPCAVSEYATTSFVKDFAESVVAYFMFYKVRAADFRAYAGEERTAREVRAQFRRALHDRLGRRFGLLHRLMHDRFDAVPELWEPPAPSRPE